jgi:hypothetical protein
MHALCRVYATVSLSFVSTVWILLVTMNEIHSEEICTNFNETANFHC